MSQYFLVFSCRQLTIKNPMIKMNVVINAGNIKLIIGLSALNLSIIKFDGRNNV